MRFYSALIPSLLLAFTVLADDPHLVGGVIITSPSNGTFDAVMTSLQVPHLSGHLYDAASVFISLDSADCATSVQLGIDFQIREASFNFSAWYRGLATNTIDEFKINPGDNINFGITAPHKSPTSAYIFIENTTSVFSLEIETKYEPCGREVQWVVTNVPSIETPGRYFDVSNFGMLELTNAMASGPTGTTYGPQEPVAQAYNMSYPNGTTVATTVVGQNSINLTYVYGQTL